MGKLDYTWEYPELAARNARQRKLRHALTIKLKLALAREAAVRQEKADLLKRQRERTVEFEHRLFNDLQLIAAALQLQSRSAPPEIAAQLQTAAGRINAFGCVHRRLSLAGDDGKIEITHHLQCLCDELGNLLFNGQAGQGIVVEGTRLEMPATLAVPIGLIVNELVTNAVKYARSGIVVRLESASPVCHAITIIDDGPGIPHGFDPADSKGLGMQIVMSLAREIGGELQFARGADGRGARVTVMFPGGDRGEARPAAGLH